MAIFGRETRDDRKVSVAAVFIKVAGCLTTDCGLDRRVDVAGCQAVPGGDVAIDVDIDRGLAKRIKDGEVVHAWHRCQNILDLVRSFLERFEIVAEELDGVLAFNPRSGFFDVVLDVLRKVKIDPRKPSFQRGIHLLGKLLLIDTARPSIERLERNI